MAATFAPTSVLSGRVSLSAKSSRCPTRKALLAPKRVAAKARGMTTRAVQEVAGADFQTEVLDVRPRRLSPHLGDDTSNMKTPGPAVWPNRM